MAGSLARNSILGGLGGISTSLAGLVSSIIVARTLGIEGAGIFAFLVWLALFATPLIELGTPAAVTRYLPELIARGEKGSADNLVSLLTRILLASAVVCVLATFFLSQSFQDSSWGQRLFETRSYLSGPIMVLVAGYAALQALGSYGLAYLRGSQNYGRIAKIALLSFVVQIGGVFLGAWIYGSIGAVIGYAVGQQLLLALTALGTARLRKRETLNPDLKARVIRYGCYAWAANIASAFLWSRVEVFFLEWSRGVEAVGFLTVALTLTSLATQGPLVLTTAILPALSEQKGLGDTERMHRIFTTSTRFLALLVYPMCFGGAAIMPVLLPAIYGEAFAPAVPAAIILICAATFHAIYVVGTNYVLAMERNDFFFFSSVLGAVFSIVAGIFFVPVFGLNGAAVSRALVQVFVALLGLWFIARRLHCPIPYAALLRIFAAAAICAATAAMWVAAVKGFAGAALAIVSGAVVYIVALRYLKAVSRDDALILGRAMHMLPGPLSRLGKKLLSFVGEKRGETNP